MDTTNSGYVKQYEYLNIFMMVTGTSIAERLKNVFKMFDQKNQRFLSKDEFLELGMIIFGVFPRNGEYELGDKVFFKNFNFFRLKIVFRVRA